MNSKPAAVLYNERKILMRKLHEEMINTQLAQSCLNCEHWNSAMNGCELYKATPPANIIVYGCEKHDYQIPF